MADSTLGGRQPAFSQTQEAFERAFSPPAGLDNARGAFVTNDGDEEDSGDERSNLWPSRGRPGDEDDDGGGDDNDEDELFGGDDIHGEDELEQAIRERGEAYAAAGQQQPQQGGGVAAVEPTWTEQPDGISTGQQLDIMPMASGMPWVALPQVDVTLPVPSVTRCTNDWRWSVWSGTGTLLGAQVQAAMVAPTCPALEQQQKQLGKLFLPVRLSVRTYVGLVQGPFGRLALRGQAGPLLDPLPEAWAAASLNVARVLVELHMLRHGPAGELDSGRDNRKPRIMHSWRDPVPSGADARPGLPHTLGMEYETLADEHVPMEAMPALDYESAMQLVQQEQQGGGPALATTRLVSMRHAVSWTMQPPGKDGTKDCVHEVVLSAPSSVWDALWSAEEGDYSNAHDVVCEPLLPPGCVPKLAGIGLRRHGLRVMMENATITGNGQED